MAPPRAEGSSRAANMRIRPMIVPAIPSAGAASAMASQLLIAAPCRPADLPAPVPPTFQNERRSARWRVHQSPAAENGLWFPHDPRRQAPSTAPPVRPAASHGGPHRDHGGDARAAADGMRKASGRNLHGDRKSTRLNSSH